MSIEYKEYRQHHEKVFIKRWPDLQPILIIHRVPYPVVGLQVNTSFL